MVRDKVRVTRHRQSADLTGAIGLRIKQPSSRPHHGRDERVLLGREDTLGKEAAFCHRARTDIGDVYLRLRRNSAAAPEPKTAIVPGFGAVTTSVASSGVVS